MAANKETNMKRVIELSARQGHRVVSRSASRDALRRAAGRAVFEQLEGRTLMSSSPFTVTSTADGTAADTGTLRWAVAQANLAPGSTTVSYTHLRAHETGRNL